MVKQMIAKANRTISSMRRDTDAPANNGKRRFSDCSAEDRADMLAQLDEYLEGNDRLTRFTVNP